MTGYTSMAAPVWDWRGEVKFAISLVGSRTTLQFDRASAHVQALLESAARATAAIGGASPDSDRTPAPTRTNDSTQVSIKSRHTTAGAHP